MKLRRIVLICMLAVCCFTALRSLLPGACLAQQGSRGDFAEASGRKYYVLSFNTTTKALEQFNWLFSDNATAAEADNGSSTGTVIIEQPGKTFADASGTYLADGDFYNGLWEATEKKYSSYYETDIYTYYSFLFYGTQLADNVLTAGIIYSTVREESTATDPKEYTSMMPYFGFLVASAAAAR